MTKIHMGCGRRDFGPEWDHIDGADFAHVKSNDIFLKDYKDNSVDLIYASHFIEYFDCDEVNELLKHWGRVLIDGYGKLRIAVPDFEKIVSQYKRISEYRLEDFLGLLYGKMQMNDRVIYHKTVYDFTSLERVLQKNSFMAIQKYDWGLTEHWNIDDHSQAYLPHMNKATGVLMSLNVEATKV